jgi:hypothetical protein
MQNQAPDQYYSARILDWQEPENLQEISCERAVPELTGSAFLRGPLILK